MRLILGGFITFILLLTQSLGGPAIGPFLESETPFLSSALLIKDEKKIDPVRRGILIPLGNNHWACFDTDLLRWGAIWKAPAGQPPLTLDSMAAISYPNGKAKAKSPPSLRGNLLHTNSARPGGGPEVLSKGDTRPSLASNPSKQIGPFPPDQGRWLGLELRGKLPVLRYRIADAVIEEILLKTADQQFKRIIHLAPHRKRFHLNLGNTFTHIHKSPLSSQHLIFRPSEEPRTLTFATQPTERATFPTPKPAEPIFPEGQIFTNLPSTKDGPYAIRKLTLPTTPRFVRPTDLAFLSDGTGLLTTLDGDVWRIETPEAKTSRWTRIASGLFETISLEVTPDDRIFTLGRDQITELIDTNGDSFIDVYRNASNAFHQTLHTRDYATSLALGNDGSFYIAKGGIHNPKSKLDNELSTHRGAVLKISPDGDSVTVLADGLRLPYVGLRSDQTPFASDQQGHHVPSTPVHQLKSTPTLGFAPTNHRDKKITEPLLWFPYQANRSAAAFTQWNDHFLQVSWGGRLFAIETPKTGQAFSWQLPLQLDFPSLNATRHPKSGKLYVTGLGISGYKPTTPNLSGIASIEETTKLPKPASLDVQGETISVTFDRPLTADETVLPASPALRLFNIKRTGKYGSGHFRWDDKPGEHHLQPDTFSLSDDRRTLTLAFPILGRSDILDLHLTLTSGNTVAPLHLFSRPIHLPLPKLSELAGLEKSKPALKPGNTKTGKTLFTTYACAGCHSLDGAKLVGPTLKGIATRSDEAFLRQSILEPAAIITEGFEASMPSFAGVLTDQQMADLLTYLKTLR